MCDCAPKLRHDAVENPFHDAAERLLQRHCRILDLIVLEVRVKVDVAVDPFGG